MKCPYCGAEITSSKCEYCNSDVSEFFSQIVSNTDANIVQTDTKPVEQKSKVTFDDILKSCIKLQKRFPDFFSVYDENRKLIAGSAVKFKLYNVLNIDKSERIYLIHDDTLFKNGGNGFAITDKAFHCKQFTERLVVTTYDEIEPNTEVDCGNSITFTVNDNIALAYLTGSEDALKAVTNLIKDIVNMK